jgi:hypothetical protein
MLPEKKLREIQKLIEYGSLKEVADRLNRKNLRPRRAEVYTSDIIGNYIRGITDDPNIELELLEWSNEKRAILASIKKLKNGK